MKPLNLNSPIVSAEWLAAHQDHPDLIILDATIKKVVPEENKSNPDIQIKNARFFDLKFSFSDKKTDLPTMLPSPEVFSEASRELGISSHHTLIIYDTFGIYSSARVWWMFHVMGHKNVAILDGGMPLWKEKGFPVETFSLTGKVKKGAFEANYTTFATVEASTILQITKDPNTLILDARSKGRFHGTEPEPREDLKGGHIPNSLSLPYSNVLKSGKMLPIIELKRIFQDFDIGNKSLIFSCGSGITACIILLAAKLAGYQHLKIYDGSWTEWGQLEGVPIETS